MSIFDIVYSDSSTSGESDAPAQAAHIKPNAVLTRALPATTTLVELFKARSERHVARHQQRWGLCAADPPDRLTITSLDELRGFGYLTAVRRMRQAWVRSQNTNSRFFMLSPLQMDAFESFIKSAAPLLFSHDPYVPWTLLCAAQGWSTPILAQCLVMTPRRFGKSTIVALFAVCLAVAIPGKDVAIFSTGQRISDTMLLLMRSIFEDIKRETGHALVLHWKHDKITIRDGKTDRNTISSLPGVSKIHTLPPSLSYMSAALS